jgi:hypothetical protein
MDEEKVKVILDKRRELGETLGGREEMGKFRFKSVGEGQRHPLGVFIKIDKRTITNLTKTFALKMQDANAVESYLRRRVLWRPPSFTTTNMLTKMNQLTWDSENPAQKLVDMFKAPEWERVNIEEVSTCTPIQVWKPKYSRYAFAFSDRNSFTSPLPRSAMEWKSRAR